MSKSIFKRSKKVNHLFEFDSKVGENTPHIKEVVTDSTNTFVRCLYHLCLKTLHFW